MPVCVVWPGWDILPSPEAQVTRAVAVGPWPTWRVRAALSRMTKEQQGQGLPAFHFLQQQFSWRDS